MKILNALQLLDLDQYSCKVQQITSWQLMERAAQLAYDEIKTTVVSAGSHKFKILAGPGNNGGDGLAIAYFLAEDGHEVDVILVNYSSSRSSDNQKSLDRLKTLSKSSISQFVEGSELPEITSVDIVIDAIFGVGLNRPMPDFVQKLARHINASSPKTIALDVPSGMYLDKSPGSKEEVFQSDLCLTFQTPKLSLYLPDYSNSVGEVKIIDIGLSQDRLEELTTEINFVDLNFAKTLYQPRSRFSHKGTYGHALIIGGSKLMQGSVLLASSSCMRSGVGKTSVMMPGRGQNSMLQYLPEAMLLENESLDHISYQDLDFNPESVGIGVGIGKSKEALKALELWLKRSTCPLVIDADALNFVAAHEHLQHQIPKKSILTPHPGELKRLVGEWKDDFEKLEKIKSLSRRLGVVVVAKDTYSLCVYKDEVYVNSTGNDGMATAGSGDVLTGLITGLLAQGYSSIDSAVLGMFIHGLAGDAAAQRISKESLIASDIVKHLGDSFLKLQD
jgi:hydroxyethylthiazole kinase-like uncharacterized protein yjeF